MSHRIGIIAGDGIGPEVIAEALKVVDATGVEYDAVPYDLSGANYLRTGEVLPDSPRRLRGMGASCSAVGTPECRPASWSRDCSCACGSSWISTSTCARSPLAR